MSTIIAQNQSALQDILNKARNMSEQEQMVYINDLISKQNITSIIRNILSLVNVAQQQKSAKINTKQASLGSKAETIMWILTVIALINLGGKMEFNNLSGKIIEPEYLSEILFIGSLGVSTLISGLRSYIAYKKAEKQ
jgi:pantothenate kinase